MSTPINIPNPERDPSGQTFLLQKALNVFGYGLLEDNWRGKRTEAALEDFARRISGVRRVRASSFADPEDVRRFRSCKATGKTDMECFRVGDNGVGRWGHFTAQENVPMAALPREDWQEAGKTGGARLRVSYNGTTVEGILGDTMPARANIRNGASLDLNPAFAKALGLTPPFLVEGVTWEWV